LSEVSFFRKIIIFIFFSLLVLCILYVPRVFEYFKGADKTINILSFIEMISPESVKIFEKQTGVPVKVTYFESGDELLAKMKINKGKGYDFLVVSDYVVELLRKANFLKEIDVKKISNFKNLNKDFLRRYFDPENKFSVPYVWTAYGFAYYKEFFGGEIENPSLDLIFKIQDKYKISMPSNAREAVFLAAKYLFGKTQDLNDVQLLEVQKLLTKQKEIVECYTSEKQDYLLYAEVVPLAVSESSFVRKMHIDSDEAKEKFGFVIPREGSMFSIENLVVLKSSTKKDEQIYTFIDFLLSAKISALNANLYGINPVNKLSYPMLDSEFVSDDSYFPSKELMGKMGTLRNDIPLSKIDGLWLAVKTG